MSNQSTAPENVKTVEEKEAERVKYGTVIPQPEPRTDHPNPVEAQTPSKINLYYVPGAT